MVEFQNTRSKQFYDYWHSLPRDKFVPHRSVFLPEEIPPLLSNMMMYELVSRDLIKIRLLGTSLCANTDSEMKRVARMAREVSLLKRIKWFSIGLFALKIA